MHIFILLTILLLLILLYLFSIRPYTKRSLQLKPFQQTYIAHRGYFDNNLSCPENSLPAFQRAVTVDYGIELDVQLTKDNQLVVFHDDSLEHMCKIPKRLSACTYAELSSYGLLGTNHTIPLLTEVLKLVAGKVPLIIEIKPKGRCIETARQLSEVMKTYAGSYCIQSFHPLVLRWYVKHAPEVLRGILSTNFKKNKLQQDPITSFLLTNLLFNWFCKPDFIAYNHNYADEFSYRLCKKLYDIPSAAWTIRNQQELNNARNTFSIFIFDDFKPVE